MSVRFLGNDASNNTDVATKTFSPLTTLQVTPWVRNPSWPACEANAGDDRVRGLYAVWPEDGNFFAVQCAGAYTVDFGDGTTTNFATFAQANYEYSYSSAALVGTEAPVTFTDTGDLVTRTAHGYTNGMQVQFFNITTTTGIVNAQFYYVINATADTFQVAATVDGSALALTNNGTGQLLPYRVATVTITPQAGNTLTYVNFFAKHNQAGLLASYSTGWLALAFASPTITSLIIGSTLTTIRHNYLESVQLNQLGSITSLSSLAPNCRAIRNVEIATSVTNTVTDMSNMFQNCTNLQTVPLFNTAGVTSMTAMFNGCNTLQTVPLFNTAGVIGMSSMFQNCNSLQTVPLFNTASVTSMSNMFNLCRSLKAVPLFNTAGVITINNMFQSCSSLQTVPLFNTATATTMAGMFSGCTTLQTVPLFNTAAVTDMSTMFSSCTNLQTVPLFNTAAATNMAGMFNGCTSVISIPALVTTAVTASTGFSTMFSSCSSLARIQAKNFRFTFSVASCKLSATALNEIYTNLPTVTAQTITVTGNYGTAADTPAIATAKGWTVTG